MNMREDRKSRGEFDKGGDEIEEYSSSQNDRLGACRKDVDGGGKRTKILILELGAL